LIYYPLLLHLNLGSFEKLILCQLLNRYQILYLIHLILIHAFINFLELFSLDVILLHCFGIISFPILAFINWRIWFTRWCNFLTFFTPELKFLIIISSIVFFIVFLLSFWFSKIHLYQVKNLMPWFNLIHWKNATNL